MYSLLLDCSHRTNFIGLFHTDKAWLSSCYFKGQPFETLTPHIKALLDDSGVAKTAIEQFYTPTNPGSQLGIRLTQIFVQSWIKTQCPSARWTEYNGLYMSARLVSEKASNLDTPKHLITEKGRMAWSTLSIDSDFILNPKISVLDAPSVDELPGSVYYLPQVKRWQPPKRSVLEIDYEPKQFLRFLSDLQRTDYDPTQLLEPQIQYLKWQAPNLTEET